MSKRARSSGGSLTGGTGDVKPQVMTITTPLSTAIDTYSIVQAALPVPRFGTMKTKATIIELLQVRWFLNLRDINDSTHLSWAYLATSTNRNTGDASTNITMAEDCAQGSSLAFAAVFYSLVTSGQSTRVYPITIDLTDNNGNGVLIATDKIFVVEGSVAAAAVSQTHCKITYRQVNVGITEYVGIVQGQQSL